MCTFALVTPIFAIGQTADTIAQSVDWDGYSPDMKQEPAIEADSMSGTRTNGPTIKGIFQPFHPAFWKAHARLGPPRLIYGPAFSLCAVGQHHDCSVRPGGLALDVRPENCGFQA